MTIFWGVEYKIINKIVINSKPRPKKSGFFVVSQALMKSKKMLDKFEKLL